ncbi:MAG: OsmC family protein [Ignavibacteriaceae bacterium]|nr:OsmC family protein [Ignavibacteriaceae bacterium]
MISEELRSIQAPIKELYRNKPEAALITLKAQGKLGENISCKIETGNILKEAGLHKATGGNGMFLCSGDMLLEALAACAGVTLSAVATSMGVEITGGNVKAEGDIDFRGTLGVSKEVPVGFKQIRLKFELDSPATEEQIQKLIELTERYCVVYQTISNPCKISLELESKLDKV